MMGCMDEVMAVHMQLTRLFAEPMKPPARTTRFERLDRRGMAACMRHDDAISWKMSLFPVLAVDRDFAFILGDISEYTQFGQNTLCSCVVYCSRFVSCMALPLLR